MSFLRENITFHGLIYPKLTWGLPTLSQPFGFAEEKLFTGCMPLMMPSYRCQDYQTNTHIVFTAIFPGKPGLAGSPRLSFAI